jgi:hypothetical protein
MPIETDPSSSTTGGTTTVGATVRDGGPGGLPRTIDVYLHVQSSKLTQKAPPSGSPHAVDSKRLSVWWKDKTLPAGGTLSFTYKLEPKPGVANEGPSEATLVVCDRGASKAFLVQRFCVCTEELSLLSHGKKAKHKAKRRQSGQSRRGA